MSRGRKLRSLHFDASDSCMDATPIGVLDLHGHTVTSAVTKVRDFVATWQRRAPGRFVRIITGKGSRSPHGSVLKPVVGKLLSTELRGLVESSCRDVDEAGYMLKLR